MHFIYTITPFKIFNIWRLYARLVGSWSKVSYHSTLGEVRAQIYSDTKTVDDTWKIQVLKNAQSSDDVIEITNDEDWTMLILKYNDDPDSFVEDNMEHEKT